jgi:geranylgeranyl pyrophosphate synthase
MFSACDEYHFINKELAVLARNLPDSPLGEILSYILSAPGKRVRPLILILSAEALDIPPAHSMSAAMAIELVHAASLRSACIPGLWISDTQAGRQPNGFGKAIRRA